MCKVAVPQQEIYMSTTQTEFYVVDGGTMRRDAQSYVERKADEDLYTSLVAGRYCHVLTSHQMGKSSLMVRTAERLRAAGVAVVDFELTRIGQNLTAEQWYNGLLSVLRNKLDPTRLGLDAELKAFWGEHMHLGPQQRLMRAIREVVLERLKSELVIFVDEIDYVRSLPFSTDEFFAGIREFYNRRAEDAELDRLTFCLLGVATPSDLIRDPRTTPFNISTRVELTDFSAVEAAPLIRGLQRDKATGSRLLERILYWTGGHPYLTQLLCLSVSKDAGITNASGVDRQCRELFLSSRSLESDVNIRDVRDRILHNNQADRASLLDLYQKIRSRQRVPDEETNPLVSVLRLSGITRAAGGLLSVRNQIYHRAFDKAWIMANMPDAEGQRQRAAYRRGLLRAAAIAMIIILAFAALAAGAVQQRNRAEQERQRAEQERARAEIALTQARDSEANLRRESIEKDRARRSAQEASERATRETQKTKDALGVAKEEQLKAETQANIASAEKLKAEGERKQADIERGRAEDATLKANDATTRTRRLLYVANMNLAQQAWEQADTSRLLELLNNERPAPGASEHRGFEWFYFWRLAHGEKSTVAGQGPSSQVIDISPDGRRVVRGNRDKTVRVSDVSTGQPELTLKAGEGDVTSVAFSPDGRLLVTGNGEGIVKIWNAENGQELRALVGPKGTVTNVAISADGKRVVASNSPAVQLDSKQALGNNTATVWDAVTGKELLTVSPDGYWNFIDGVAISPDGRFAVLNKERETRVWDLATGQEKFALAGHTGLLYALAFSPDGGRLLTGSADGTAKIWDAQTGEELVTLKGHTGPNPAVYSLAFSADGKRVATGSADRTVRIWAADSGQELLTIRGFESPVIYAVRFSADGKRVVTGDENGTVKVWDAEADQEALILRELRGELISAAFSPDDRHIITVGNDRNARLWNAATGQAVLTLTGKLFSEAFSPDARFLATGYEDGLTKVWDIATRQVVLTLKGQSGSVIKVAFSPNGKRIVTSSRNNAFVWETATGNVVLTLKGHRATIDSAAFSSDGRCILTGSVDGTAKVWDAVGGQDLFTVKGTYASPVFSPDGNRVANYDERNALRIWDVTTGREMFPLGEQPATIASIAFSPDGRRIVTGNSDHTAKIWDAADGRELFTLRGHAGWINRVAFSSDSKSIVTAGASDSISGNSDFTARIWDVATGRETQTLKGHSNSIRSAAFSSDGRRIVTSSLDNTARVWNAENGEEVFALKEHGNGFSDNVFSVAFSPDGKRIVTGTSDNISKVRDAATGEVVLLLTGHVGSVQDVVFSRDGKRIGTIEGGGATKVWDAGTGALLLAFKEATSIDFSPDGKRIVTGGASISFPKRPVENTARIWDATTGQYLLTLQGHQATVFSVAFSPDGWSIVTASADGTAKVWDATNGRELRTLRGHQGYVLSAAFSNDNQRIVTTSSDHTARVWDARTGEPLQELKEHIADVNSAAFSRDGKRIVTGSDDGTAKLWDTETGLVTLTFRRHTASVNSVAFSPDGTRVATASEDGTVRIWSAETSGEPLVPELYRLGVNYARGREFPKALELFTQILILSPEDISALVARAFVYLELKNIEAAMGDCSKAVSVNPKDLNARFCRGYVFHLKGDLDAARRNYIEVLTLNAGNVGAHYNLACIYSLRSLTRAKDSTGERLRTEDFAAAFEHLENAIKYGYLDWEHMKVDSDLDPIRADPRFLQIMKDH
jgi:WD40 repeat protein